MAPRDPIQPETSKEQIDQRKKDLEQLKSLSESFGQSLTNTFAKGVAERNKFDVVLKSLRQSTF